MQVCGLIGGSLPHSYSKIIHDIISDKKYSYRLMPMPEEEVELTLAAKNFRGLNVTIPYKRTVIPFCDELTPESRRIGSVNTIVNDGGRLIGHNTDYAGFEYMAAAANISFGGKKVLILGSGGTSLTAQAVTADGGAREIIVMSRNPSQAKAAALTARYDEIDRHLDSEVIINTTPVGMYPENGARPIEIDRFSALSGVIDAIYNPLRTPLVLDARARGAAHTGGLVMLVAQAVRAAELFLGEPLGNEVIRQTLCKVERQVMNIVLIGMAGCGKSAVGRLAAKRLGMDFIDTDEIIETQAKLTIPEIFAKYGENTFRRLEAETAAKLRDAGGVVISTGGGLPINQENYENIAQNGRLFMLRRPLEQLSLAGRPLCPTTDDAHKLYSARLPVYLSRADVIVENTAAIEDAADAIVNNVLNPF